MLDKLKTIEDRYNEVNRLLQDPRVAQKPDSLRDLGRESQQLKPIVETYKGLQKTISDLAGAKEILLKETDPELVALAKEELFSLEAREKQLNEQLKIHLLPRDPNDGKNVIIEIRGGTGGDEAALFAGELFRMYARFAEDRGWKTEIMSSSDGAQGGYKEIIASFEGGDVFSMLKYESGVHRVQRVPATETQGRIHTSAVTVAVLPEAEPIDVQIEDKDLRIDVYRSSGPGGQSVNTTDSAVRVTHIPTGMVVACQDEKSQHKNKAKALKILRARLFEKMRAEQEAKMAAERKQMVRSGDRSEKIRTYNFPQDRLTDHRIGLTVHNLPKLLAGDLLHVIEALRTHFQAEALNAGV